MALSQKTQSFLNSLGMFGWKLGLDRMWAIVRELGMPQDRFKVIHIAGSNGKGSVARILEAVYLKQGYRVGVYLSPHLISPTERIRIQGRAISDSAFDSVLQNIRPVLERHQATYFEALTAMAFTAFAQSEVDLAIVETGLGGRLDATNIVQPCATAITSISLEHRQYLGDRLEAIAAEKGGIIKPETPCIVGELQPEAMAVIAQICKQQHAPLIQAREQVGAEARKRYFAGMELTIRWPGHALLVAQTRLLGRHQVTNIRTALALIAVLQTKFPVRLQAITDGLASVVLPARMQVVQTDRLMILDVAHNPESMQALVEALIDLAPDKRWLVLIGVLQDKQVDDMLESWKHLSAEFLCVQPPSDRALDARTLRDMLLGLSQRADAFASLEEADFEAWRRIKTGRADALVVTGSHYTVGPFMQMKKIRVP